MLIKYFKYILIIYSFTVFVSCSNQNVTNHKKWATRIPAQHLENLFLVSDSVYRSEQPDKKSFKEIEKLGISSVLNLRTSETDEEEANGRDLNLFIVEMKSENIDESKVIEALKIIKNSPKPILVHCKHGSDRTGLIIAMYRIVFQGWDRQSAIDELKNGGFGFHFFYFNIPSFIENVDIKKIKEAIK
jgi:tyrosine-protein phosphatase SIW14